MKDVSEIMNFYKQTPFLVAFAAKDDQVILKLTFNQHQGLVCQLEDFVQTGRCSLLTAHQILSELNCTYAEDGFVVSWTSLKRLCVKLHCLVAEKEVTEKESAQIFNELYDADKPDEDLSEIEEWLVAEIDKFYYV
ncbi:hypothetical protein [Paenibacillus chitinolyticus]|uniref:hypothetical protein n=1 Tax=Paenibacillus chitinolyticus TaxID=79263 RepID=UPI003D009623